MLGDKLKELREAKCWSQAHLADAAGLNVRTVQRIEAGEPCSYETMLSLAAALSVDVSTFEPDPRASRLQTAFVSKRLGLAALSLLPAALFILLNLLRSPGGITGPYDALAVIGSKIMSFQTFNLVSPVVFVGGAAIAILVCVPVFLRIRSRKDGGVLSITGLEVRAEWAAIILAAAALCSLIALVIYAGLEQLFTAFR